MRLVIGRLTMYPALNLHNECSSGVDDLFFCQMRILTAILVLKNGIKLKHLICPSDMTSSCLN